MVQNTRGNQYCGHTSKSACAGIGQRTFPHNLCPITLNAPFPWQRFTGTASIHVMRRPQGPQGNFVVNAFAENDTRDRQFSRTHGCTSPVDGSRSGHAFTHHGHYRCRAFAPTPSSVLKRLRGSYTSIRPSLHRDDPRPCLHRLKQVKDMPLASHIRPSHQG